MKKVMSFASNLTKLSWDNGAQITGQLLSVEPSFCHTPQEKDYREYRRSLFTIPKFSFLNGRGISS